MRSPPCRFYEPTYFSMDNPHCYDLKEKLEALKTTKNERESCQNADGLRESLSAEGTKNTIVESETNKNGIQTFDNTLPYSLCLPLTTSHNDAVLNRCNEGSFLETIVFSMALSPES